MYAIVDIAGQQFKVGKAEKVYVHRLQADEGSQIELKNVLLIDNDSKIEVGKPNIEGAHILAEVVEHLKGDKILVFHKKRRKGYQKMNGHRQYLTRLNILSIMKDGVSLTGDNASSVKKQEKEVVKKAETEPKAEKVATKKTTTPKKTATTDKATSAKKPATTKKATTAKKTAATKKEKE